MDQDAPAPAGPVWVRRFDRFDRSLHILLMASFLGLSLTGVPLLFSEKPWAATLSRLFGGFRSAATLHRIFATGMLVCFGSHLARLAKRLFGDKEYGILWGPSSLVPQPRDLIGPRAARALVSRERRASALRALHRTGKNSTTGPCSGAWGSSEAPG